MVVLRIHFVRHGVTDANRKRIVQGHLDIELNELGHQQAKAVAEHLRHVHFDMAFSSDLSRSAKTAETILSYHPGVTLELHHDLRGQFMGNFQGKEYTPGMAFPVDETVETTDAFTERVNRWWNEHLLGYLASLSPKPDMAPHEVLVVTHEAVIGTLMQSLIQQQKLTCAPGTVVSTPPNTSVSVVEVEMDGTGIIKEYGKASHIEGMVELRKTDINPVDDGGVRN